MIIAAPKLPLDVIRTAVLSAVGLGGDFLPLDGERDQNHRLDTSHGQFVVKVCSPEEGTGIVECQAAALEHIARVDPALPVPRVHSTRSGKLLHRLVHEDREYPLLVLTWLKGKPPGNTPLSISQYGELGTLIGRLNKALRGFIHAGPASRNLAWNTANVHHLRDKTAALSGADRTLVEAVLDVHAEHVAPRLPMLPAQIMHADVHPYNVLMNEDGMFSGIIDFGDMVHAPRVQEIANSLADCLVPGLGLEQMIIAMAGGFVRHVRLHDEEIALVLPLMRSRLALSALVTALRHELQAGVTPQIAALDAVSIAMLQVLSKPGLEDVVRYALLGDASARRASVTVDRRLAAMGPKPLLFYDRPLHIVRGEGVWLTSSDGREFLDCYNNVPHVGHCNPHVTQAVVRQLRRLNTNTRYLTDESIAYAERLKATVDPSLDTVIFVNSGSEANDVAYRMAKAWSGQSGMLVMDFAYHGVTDASDAMSPSNYPEGKFRKPQIRELEAPDPYRGPHREQRGDPADLYAAYADQAIESLKSAGYGLALSIIDSAFMTNGIISAPAGYVQRIAGKTRAAGGLFVADEVQSGFGRMGTHFWGHHHHGVIPDLVTIGKPAGNGYPLGAIITRAEILERFVAETGPFFSTFGGGNAACAAGLAVLEVIEREGLAQHAEETGAYFRAALTALMQRHALIGDVRGSGLAIGVELVTDRASRLPAKNETRHVTNAMKDHGVLVGSDGKLGNVLKIRPPIVFTRKEADLAVLALDKSLAQLG